MGISWTLSLNVGHVVRIAGVLGPVCAWDLLPRYKATVVWTDINLQVARGIQGHAELVQDISERIPSCPSVVTAGRVQFQLIGGEVRQDDDRRGITSCIEALHERLERARIPD